MKRKLIMSAVIGAGVLAVAGVIYGPELWNGYRFISIVEKQAEQARAEAGPWPQLQDSCALCHGAMGQASNEHYPSLAGLSADYLQAQLNAFADGSRPHSQMTPLAASLSEEQIQTLSVYYQKQTPTQNQRVSMESEALVQGKALTQQNGCVACHGETLMGSSLGPRLAGQGRGYLVDQLEAYKSGRRQDSSGAMAGVTANLDAEQMGLVAGYISSLEPQTP